MDWLSQIFTTLSESPYAGAAVLLGLFLTGVGVALGIVSIIWMVRWRKYKRLCYALKSSTVFTKLTDRAPFVTVTSDQGPVDNLTVTNLALWNGGNDAIRKSDVPPSEPLRIRVKDQCQILDVSLSHQSDPANEIRLCEGSQGSRIEIDFEYLNPRDGAVVKIAHTGQSSDDIQIKGKLIGPIPMERKSPQAGTQVSRKRLWKEFAGRLAMIGMLVVLMIVTYSRFGWSPAVGSLMGAFWALLGFLTSMMVTSYRYLRRGVPAEFNIFLSDF